MKGSEFFQAEGSDHDSSAGSDQRRRSHSINARLLATENGYKVQLIFLLLDLSQLLCRPCRSIRYVGPEELLPVAEEALLSLPCCRVGKYT